MRFAALILLVALSAAAPAENADVGSGSLIMTVGNKTDSILDSLASVTSDSSETGLVTVTGGDAPAELLLTEPANPGPVGGVDVTTTLDGIGPSEDPDIEVEAAADTDVASQPAANDPASPLIATAKQIGLTDAQDQFVASAALADAEEMQSFCERIDVKLSSVASEECLRIGLLDSGADSNEKTPLLFKDFPTGEDESTARVLLVGGVHGDEYSSVSIVFKWLAMLEEDLGDNFYWRVIPVLNPDGLLRPPRMSTRMNANGVDLNRNFPTPNWENEALDYWVNKTDKNERRYPGPAPLSEPETAWLVEQIETFQPHAVIAVHAPHGVVDFDGPRIPPRQLGPLELRLLGTYPGSMGRYVGIHKGIPLLTLELESAFGMPAQNEVYDIWYDMLGWLHEKIAVPLQLAEEGKSGMPTSELMKIRPNPDEG